MPDDTPPPTKKRGRKATQKPTTATSRPAVPFYFLKAQATIFDTVVDLLDQKGTLGECDISSIEAYALTYDLMRRAALDIQQNGITNQTSQGRGRNPACDILDKSVAKLITLTRKMKLDPGELSKATNALSYQDDPDFDVFNEEGLLDD
jgi:P27 family predicted phage terminase small subunit